MMNLLILLVILAVASFFLWLFLQPKQGQVASNRALDLSSQQPKRPSSPRSITPEMNEHLELLLQKNQKIAALKLIRQETGWGLRQAKDYLESLGSEPARIPEESEVELRQVVSELLIQGKAIEGIKYVRQKTGVGLKEAKNYVDQVKSSLRED